MSMRTLVLFAPFALGLSWIGLAAGADPAAFAPTALPIDHYAAIWKRSPFITETVAVQVSAGLATKYSLVGIVPIGGQPAIFLLDKNNGDPTKNRLLISKTHASKEGIELVSVEVASNPRKSSAIIRQGGQQATLPFDTAAMGPTGPNSQPGAVPPPPSALMPPPIIQPGVNPLNRINNPAAPTSPRRIIRPAPINLNN